MNEKKSIGHAIMMARTELGWSQGELGEALGVKYQTIGTWERDEVVPPRSRWKKIKELCGISVQELKESTLTVTASGAGSTANSGRLYQVGNGVHLSAEEQTLINTLRRHGEKSPLIIIKILGMIDEISEKIT